MAFVLISLFSAFAFASPNFFCRDLGAGNKSCNNGYYCVDTGSGNLRCAYDVRTVEFWQTQNANAGQADRFWPPNSASFYCQGFTHGNKTCDNGYYCMDAGGSDNLYCSTR